MRRDLRADDDGARSGDGGRFSSAVSKPVRLRLPTRAGAGLIALLLVVPLDLTSESGPAATWTIPTGHPGYVSAVAIVPDGRRIATAGSDGGVVLWAVGRGLERELPGASRDAMSCSVHLM
jgi:WD40 repeat protein